jgi:toxin ParE1/3/4
MAHSISIIQEAEQEIEESLIFYAEISPQLLLELLAEIESVKTDILKNPFRFQAVSKNYRKASLKVYPYKIIFRILPQEVLILAFAHHKRKPNYWRHRE